MTVVRDVMLLCVPPSLHPFQTAVAGEANSQEFDVSLLYRLILYAPCVAVTFARSFNLQIL